MSTAIQKTTENEHFRLSLSLLLEADREKKFIVSIIDLKGEVQPEVGYKKGKLIETRRLPIDGFMLRGNAIDTATMFAEKQIRKHMPESTDVDFFMNFVKEALKKWPYNQ